MNEIYLLTGGNIGDRLKYLEQAAMQLEKFAGPILQKSSVYETAPWGLAEQEPFLNQVLHVSTQLKAEEVLQTIFTVEQQLGRKRLQKNGPRTIDIDILFYNDNVISSPDLIVPHPQIANRRFVLTPLNEIASGLTHPVLQKTITELLAICPDELEVKEYI